MRKLISLMHVSLDGFCAGPKGEMDWIGYNDTIFADATTLIHGPEPRSMAGSCMT